MSLALAVFLASLLGSAHCAGMCGGFLAFAVGDTDSPVPAKWLHAAYNAGRLATYLAMGILAGSIGAALDIGGAAVGVQRAAAIGAGAMMIGFGLVAVLRNLGVHVGRFPLPAFMQKLALSGHRGAADLPPILRGGAVGLLTTLLPCGWLYAFVATAAGTGSPALGAVAMAAFWLGTLPVMVTLGTAMGSMSGRLRRHLPLATSLLMVAAGLATVAQRVRTIGRGQVVPIVSVSSHALGIGPTEEPLLCHGR